MRKIDADTPFTQHALLIRIVRALAAAFPEHVYTRSFGVGCKYAPDARNPMGCIFGAALRTLGIEPGELQTIDNALMARETDDSALDSLILWMTDVQSAQDNGTSWGTAVKWADNNALNNGRVVPA